MRISDWSSDVCSADLFATSPAYGDHVDDALMGGDDPVRSDLSVTVFLNDPAEYEGGELVLDTPGGEQVFKLPLGAAVVYSSTTLHRVEPVTAGVRRAAVTWVQSLVRAGARRDGKSGVEGKGGGEGV